jgi:hypothetical protein
MENNVASSLSMKNGQAVVPSVLRTRSSARAQFEVKQSVWAWFAFSGLRIDSSLNRSL